MKKNIAVVAGGYSGEYEVSIKSSTIVAQSIDKEEYNVYLIVIDKQGWFYQDNVNGHIPVDKNDFSIALGCDKISFDCVLIMIHGTPGEDGCLQGYFDMLGIPYTGCNAITSALTFNKAYCNAVVRQSNMVNVSKSVHLFKNRNNNEEKVLQNLSFPCFVKPNAGGSSVGMSKVKQAQELKEALSKAFAEDSQVLVEEFIKGRELTCGMFRTSKAEMVFPITEIISKKEFFDYEAKYKGFSDEITPADIPAELAEKIQETAKKLAEILNCIGLVRFDFIFEEATQKLFFLEVNTVPGQSAQSIVPQQIRAMGKTTTEIYSLLIEAAINKE